MLILIAGITGTCGQACALAALKAGHQVRGLGRNPEKLKPEISEHLESFVKTNDIYDIPALDKAVAKVDAVIAALTAVPEVILEGQLLLLRAAERAGVKIFHSASWNFDWTKIPLREIDIYDPYISFWNHAEMSSTIKPLHGFVGIILEYMMYRVPEANPINKDASTFTYFGSGDEMSIYTTVDDLAAYTIQAVSERNAAEGGCYYVESFRRTNRQLASEYEEVRGTKLEMKRLGSVEDVDALAANAKANIPRTRFMEYNGLVFAKHLLRGSLTFEPVDSKRWGHIKQKDWKTWLRENPGV